MALSLTPAAQSFAALRFVILFVFMLSGFAGLVYESIWATYLKLLLGHAAYAQTLVLIIYMGGMALGSSIASVRVFRWRNLLLGYAIVAGLIGLAGLVFRDIFDASMWLAHETVSRYSLLRPKSVYLNGHSRQLGWRHKP
jgi:spermidine synthase